MSAHLPPPEYQIENKGSRLHYFDGLRGTSMVLVVLGHVLMCMGMGGYNTVLGTILLTFRMPLFFFVSGFFAYRACEKWTLSVTGDVMKRKIQAQIICTLVFFSLFQYCLGNDIFSWTQYGFGGYWFTIVLFQIFVIYLLLSLLAKWLRRGWLMDAGMVAGSCISLGVLIFFRGDSTLWNVLCMENFCKYFHFFTFGLLARKYQDIFTGLLSRSWFMTCSILAFVCCLVLYYHEGFKLSGGILYMAVHDILVRYAGLLAVIGFFFHKKEFFSQNNKLSNTLKFIGRRTLDIYMIHYFFLPDLSFMQDFLMDGNMLIIQLGISLFMASVIIALCLGISAILRTSPFLTSWLFGVKAKKTASH